MEEDRVDEPLTLRRRQFNRIRNFTLTLDTQIVIILIVLGIITAIWIISSIWFPLTGHPAYDLPGHIRAGMIG